MPAQVPGATGTLYDLSFAGDGGGVLTSLCCGGFGPGVPATRMSFAAPGGAFGQWRKVASRFAARGVMGTPAGRFAVGWVPAAHGRTDTAVATLVGSRMAKPAQVLPAMVATSQFAGDLAGDAAVIGQVSSKAPSRSTRRAIYLVVRRAGHGWSRPLRLAGRGGPALLSVAVAPGGAVLAAWTRGSAVFVRERSATGALGPLQRIRTGVSIAALVAALTAGGDGAVGWLDPGASGTGPTDVRVALSTAAGTFPPSQSLELVPGLAAPLQLAATSADTIDVAWIGRDDSGSNVVRAAGARLGVIAPTQTVGGPGAVDLKLAGDESGDAVATWLEPASVGGGQMLRAAVHGAGSDAFGTPEDVAGPAQIGFNLVTFNPATAQPWIAWQTSVGDTTFVASRSEP